MSEVSTMQEETRMVPPRLVALSDARWRKMLPPLPVTPSTRDEFDRGPQELRQSSVHRAGRTRAARKA